MADISSGDRSYYRSVVPRYIAFFHQYLSCLLIFNPNIKDQCVWARVLKLNSVHYIFVVEVVQRLTSSVCARLTVILRRDRNM
jgi:hypothetical protein